MKFRIWNDLDPIDALDVREGKPLDPQGRRHDARASDVGPAAEPGGSVRREQTNLTGLVLSCIEARFCKKIRVYLQNSNAYLLAKFRFDTAENERNFARNLPKTDNYPTDPTAAEDDKRIQSGT